MGAEVEIREFDTSDFSVATLAEHIGPDLIAGRSETEFTIGASDSRRVIANVDLAARKISFVGYYSSYSDSIFDTITRIADHLKGQIFVEGEPWHPKEDHLNGARSTPWWVWLILLPFILVIFVVALPFLLVYWCCQLWRFWRKA